MNWRQSCRYSSKVLTISEYSKQSISEKYRLQPDKITVTPPSVGNEFLLSHSENDAKVIEKYSLPQNYFFYPANAWAHKNHQLLLIGVALQKKRSDNKGLKLVLSGINDAGEQLQTLIDRHGLKDDVVFIGRIKREEMPVVYRNAKFMIFPSVFEGFGIPLLEAMASDCPIAASNTTSIPEVAGDAALYFDPRNPDAIADTIDRMINDDALLQTLVQAGRKRLAEYSWDKTAEQTIEVLESLGKNTGG